MAVVSPVRTSPALQALRTAVASRVSSAQAEIASRVAAARSGIPIPPPATPVQKAIQARETLQAARTAGSAAAAEVRAAGGTSAQQSSAAIQAGVKAASQAVIAQAAARVEAVEKQVADAREKNKSEWWYSAPWYPVWDPTRTRVPDFDHDINLFNWLLNYVKSKKSPDVFPEPPRDRKWAWSSWVQVMARNFGLDFVPAPPQGDPLYLVWKDALNRATHPGGTFGRILTETKSVVSKIGSILITLVGAVLAPFTGGASALAATLIVSANKVRVAAVNAASASRANNAAAAAQQADAARQAAALEAQVNDFYNNNQAWFLQHGVTTDSWVKLTLDQKVELIRAGSAGQLPVTPASNPMQSALQAQPSQARVPTTQGPVGSAPTSSVPVQNVSGSFRLDVEGRTFATAGSSTDIMNAVQGNTSIGDRFEIFQDGRSLGLKIRTADGAISIPDDKAAQIRAMSHADVLKLLETASESAGASSGSGGGLLLLLALPAVAFVATKK